MAEWQSDDVVANGIRVHYYRTGGSGPPLVLNHGATDNGLCWIRLASALEGDYDVIMPDARGHGRSEAPENGYSSGDRAADLASLIQALGLERPVIGGHSMGAQTCLRCAAAYPELVRSAILEDPPIWADGPPPMDEGRRTRMRQDADERRSMSREALMARGREQNPAWDEVELEPWADAKRQVSPAFSSRPFFQNEPSWQDVVPNITAPTLLITSDPDRGGIVTPEVAEAARALNSGIQVVRLSGAGHNIRREQFDAFLGAVRAFLAAY